MIIYIMLYFMFYFAAGTTMLYFSQYFITIGISGGELGVIFATGSFLAMIIQPFLGYLNDKTKKSKEMLLLIMLIIATSLLSIKDVISYKGVLTLYSVYIIGTLSLMPLIDTLVLNTKFEFGKMRMWGSVGFAVGALIAGKTIEVFGDYSFLYLGVLSMLLSALVVLKIPKLDVEDSKDFENIEIKEKVDLKKLFKNKKYILFIIVATLVLGTTNGHNSYFAIYFKSIGGSVALLGTTVFLMTLSEVPFIGISSKLVQRKSVGFAIMLAIGLMVFRWGEYYLLPKPMLITSTFFSQGASIGLFFATANLFVREVVEKNTLGTAITIYMAAGSLGGMFIQYISGRIIENSSPIYIYGFYLALVIVAFVLMYVNLKEKKEVNKEN